MGRQVQIECPDCDTTGEDADGNICDTCKGDGYVWEDIDQ
jgi:DnaJ-class molecular chaperone